MKFFCLALLLPYLAAAAPTVRLDSATVTGTTVGSLNKFLGIPFAKAPRFDLPVAVSPYSGSLTATAFGPSCPVQLQPNSAPPDPNTANEECLSLNVYVPTSATASSKLPVAVYIYGGAFSFGDTKGSDQVISRVSQKSISVNVPIIQVSMNYRISAYGFLAGNEVDKAKTGNVGLYDQRAALVWVQKYIAAFGGDPSKVVIYGQSAGAMSATLQTLAFGGDIQNLFRGALMQSGGPLSLGTLASGQKYYNALVASAGCASSSNTLQCLKTIPFNTLQTALSQAASPLGYKSSLVWSPLVDGTFVQQNPYTQIKTSNVPNIPILSGNCDDEGTVFSLAQSNLTTENDFRNFVKSIWLYKSSDQDLAPLWSRYPADPSQGSPFDTGSANQAYPQYKRVAAFQGDLLFQGARRYFLKNRSGKQKLYSYLSKNLKSSGGIVGSHHGCEQSAEFLDEYVVRFVANLNPNSGSGTAWPEYTSSSPSQMTFEDNKQPSVQQDTYRSAAIDLVNDLFAANPFVI